MNKLGIVIKDLSVGYQTSLGKNRVIFGPVNAEVHRGEMVGIIGRNGIGKSTLLRTIAGLQTPLSGDILINDINNHNRKLKDMAKLISFVSTEPVYARQIKVIELITMGRFPYTGWLGNLNNHDRQAIEAAVVQTGVGPLSRKQIYELSDGERQKVMIARALAQDTPLIILDEPTAFLDLPARYEILRILQELTSNHGKTVLFSTHDLSIAMDVADRLWVMTENEIFQGAPEDLLISKVFRKLFLNSPAEFDIKTFTFRFKRELKKAVNVTGERKYRLLTKRALERIGFQPVEDAESEISIVLTDQNGLPLWRLVQDKTETIFDSIYTLAKHLKPYC
jgi:iron complex transport system ATP-binding protein